MNSASEGHFENSAISAGDLPSLRDGPNSPNYQYERSDWVLFRSVNTLPQKAGVPADKLRRLVLKELADNALDIGASVQAGRLDDPNGFYVQDDGPGIDPEMIGSLFSINRPLISSKLWRLPTRGAMGNGLRVVAGSVVASGGRLRVFTRGQRFDLFPRDDGGTDVQAAPSVFAEGTRVEIVFGDAIPSDPSALAWARMAIRSAGAERYTGKSSPWWYDADAFYELMQAAGDRPVRSLVADLDGCSGAKAGQIAKAHIGRSCASMSREDAVAILEAAQAVARPVKAARLPVIGPDALGGRAYDCQRGEFTFGARKPLATAPVAVEAWVTIAPAPAGEKPDPTVQVMVNRSPITGDVEGYRREGAHISIHGSGIHHRFEMPRGAVTITINITTPFCPITTDGKEPDLSPFINLLFDAVEKAGRKARRASLTAAKESGGERITAKSVVLAVLAEAIDKASGGGAYRFNQRQLFYVVRPAVMAALGVELAYKNFENIITDYEAENGDVPGMYRDPRGSLYHPHTGETIPLGTLAVEAYRRPEWTFNKVLYIEKEGPFEALKAARWPERHDCALLTSKGYTTRAVKDLLDLLGGDGEEEVTVFCIHDADASGTMIYQTLQEETRARPTRRTVNIVNLGLDPWEAVGMGLEVEGVEKRDRASAVAQYLLDREDGEHWRQWLETRRVELNAMTTPDFIAWLDEKMAAYAGGKVHPPCPVLTEEMRNRTANHLRANITARVLREASIDEKVQNALAGVPEPSGEAMATALREWLEANQASLWREYVDTLAQEAAAHTGDD